MSARFDAGGDALYRNSLLGESIPQANTLTVSGWVNLVSDINAAGAVFGRIGDAAAGTIYEGIYIDASGTGLVVDTSATGTSAASTLTVGTWTYVTYRRNGTTHDLLIDGVVAQTVTGTPGADNNPAFLFGGNGATYVNGEFARWRIWEAALSNAEVLAEKFSSKPVRTTNLWADYDMASGALATDSSGNSRTLNVLGTVTNGTSNPPQAAVAADTIALSDSAVAITTRVAIAADTITLSDSAVAITTRVAVASDTITLSDSADAATAFAVTATDTITLSDSAVAATAFAAAATDTITLSDSATAISSRSAVAADTITLSDSADAITSRVAVAADTITLSDSADAVTTRVAEASDTITLSDSADAVVTTGGIVVVAEDTIAFSDSAVASVAAVADATDTITLSDSADAITTRVAVAADTITLSDSAEASMALTAVAEDTISFSDSAVGSVSTGVVTAVAEDTIVLSDSAICIKIPNVPPQAFGGGWVLYPNAVKPKGKKRKEEDEWAADTRARRQALEEAIQALQPPQERQTVRLPYTAPPPAAVVGLEAAKAVQELRDDIVGHVTRAKVRQSIERAQEAVDKEVRRREQVRKNNEFLMNLEW